MCVLMSTVALLGSRSMEEVTDLKERLLRDSTLYGRLERVKDLSSVEANACIYRVHGGLRAAETEAHYKPLLVSIGPYHHGGKKLGALMEEHKLRYLNSFLKRTKKRLEDCKSIVEGHVGSALKCYAEPIMMDRNEFVELLLLDSCFIIEFLSRWIDGGAKAYPRDPLFNSPWMWTQILRDFLLLENQVPLCLPFQHLGGTYWSRDQLVKIAEIFITKIIRFKLPPSQPQPHHFLDCFPHSVKNFMGKSPKYSPPGAHDDVEGQQRHPGNVEYKHFLDLLTKICVPSKMEEEEKKKDKKGKKTCNFEMPCVKELREGSITFEVNESKGVTLFDIEFHSKYRWLRSARLRIPRLTVDDNTETFLRNIIAYEQHNLEAEFRYFTDYTCFLNQLINSGEDVTYLRLHKIIKNRLGDDDEVASLINRLGRGRVIGDNYYYSQLCQRVNDHYGRTWNQTMATLRRTYFNNPWAWVSTLAALVLLFLTTASTVIALIDAFK